MPEKELTLDDFIVAEVGRGKGDKVALPYCKFAKDSPEAQVINKIRRTCPITPKMIMFLLQKYILPKCTK